MGMKFGDNADGAGKAIKSLFGKAKKAVVGAGTMVDGAISKVVKKETKDLGPHIEIVETIHLETPLPEVKIHEETPLPEAGENTGWFNEEA